MSLNNINFTVAPTLPPGAGRDLAARVDASTRIVRSNFQSFLKNYLTLDSTGDKSAVLSLLRTYSAAPEGLKQALPGVTGAAVKDESTADHLALTVTGLWEGVVFAIIVTSLGQDTVLVTGPGDAAQIAQEQDATKAAQG